MTDQKISVGGCRRVKQTEPRICDPTTGLTAYQRHREDGAPWQSENERHGAGERRVASYRDLLDNLFLPATPMFNDLVKALRSREGGGEEGPCRTWCYAPGHGNSHRCHGTVTGPCRCGCHGVHEAACAFKIHGPEYRCDCGVERNDARAAAPVVSGEQLEKMTRAYGATLYSHTQLWNGDRWAVLEILRAAGIEAE